MTASGLWQDIGAGENLFTRILRLLFLALAAIVLCFMALLPLNWQQQSILALVSVLAALVIGRISDSYLATLTLMMVSMFCTFRYGYWRVLQIVRFVRDPSTHVAVVDLIFILCLLLAELYAFAILFLGYFQTIWPLRRAPVAMPESTAEWPHIDVFIPTYNEPLDVVRYTALGALNVDWPVDKLHIYILDDGRREEFEEFAREAGIGYRTRPNNRFAKAGNINAALKSTDSPFIAIFDADHVPTRSFLQLTVGWFLRDPRLAVLQTPHHFYSPDPFERNLHQFRVIPNDGELFYGVVQDGNDFWNSAFFCGSCAVLRRDALRDVGGMAVETVTEDAHTALRMQTKGWNTAYINIPQAAGLATGRLSAHVRQRIRWARGMVQILRTDNPLFAPNLTLAQRLCYFNAMGHFLYALPRLIFLAAPLIYLLFGQISIPGYWGAILAYALPHLMLSIVANSRIQGEYRYSFWNDIYETVAAPYILLPTLLAFLSPRRGGFNVTSKDIVVERTFVDTRMAWPFFFLLLANLAGLALAIHRFFFSDIAHRGTIAVNVLWCGFNIVILGVCIAVARELRQRRATVRINVAASLAVKLPAGNAIAGETVDISGGGAGIRLSQPIEAPFPAQVRLAFTFPPNASDLPATVVSADRTYLRVHFDNLSIPEQEVLTVALYSRADSWIGLAASRKPDSVLRSLLHIFAISVRGLAAAVFTPFGRPEKPSRKDKTLSILESSGVLLLAGFLALAPARIHAQVASSAAVRPASPAPAAIAASPALAPGQYHSIFTLADAGARQIELRGVDSHRNIQFALPVTYSVRTAKIHVNYAFSPGLLPQLSQLKLLLNGTLIGTIQPTANPAGGSDPSAAEAEFPISSDLLKRNNVLAIEFIGHYAASCEDPANTALWARVDGRTSIDIDGGLEPLANDLKQLPGPFFDPAPIPAVIQPPVLPVVFLSQPSFQAIQAAGIVTSYFGLVAENHAMRFPVHIGDIPAGNAIVVAENPDSLPQELNLSGVSAPTVAMRTNPGDPFGKLLIVTGAGAGQLLAAAQAIALRSDMLAGPQASIAALQLPAQRAPDDAPRWLNTGQNIPLAGLDGPEELQGDGAAPINIYFRTPPDIFYGAGWYTDRPNALLRLKYRYNAVPLGPASTLQVRANGAFLGSLPLIPGQDSAHTAQSDLSVPVVSLRPFSNTLSFGYAFQIHKKDGCDSTPHNLQGSILRDSYLDLRGFPHWAAMPNLEIFANAGFPFTRIADLGETTVVLPPTPSAQEIEIFLTLMGHFGRQTGYPALRVAVSGPDALRDGAHSDFLVLGTGDDQPGFNALAAHLPVVFQNGQVQVHDTAGLFAPLHRYQWWKLFHPDHAESGDLSAAGSPDALIEGIESPFDVVGNRSIVLIHLKDPASAAPFLATFLDVQQSSDISGAVSVLHGSRFQSFRMGTTVYHVGALPRWMSVMLWFSQMPWLVALVVIVFAFLLAIWMRQWLRARARTRLTMLQD